MCFSHASEWERWPQKFSSTSFLESSHHFGGGFFHVVLEVNRKGKIQRHGEASLGPSNSTKSFKMLLNVPDSELPAGNKCRSVWLSDPDRPCSNDHWKQWHYQPEWSLTEFSRQFWTASHGVVWARSPALPRVAGEADSFTTFRKKVTLLRTFSISDPCPGESF